MAHPRSHAKNELDRKDAGIGLQQVQMAMLVPTGDDVKNMACFSENSPIRAGIFCWELFAGLLSLPCLQSIY